MPSANPLDYIEPGFAALLIALGIFAIVAFAKGWVVPKLFYDRLEQQNDKLTDAVSKHADAFDKVMEELREIRRGRKE